MSSNYPNGFASGVTIRGIPLQQMHPGEVFHVNNSGVNSKGAISDSNNNDGSFLAPFTSITYALTQCTANRGDIIVCGADHNELVATAAAAGITFNVAGVAIVGLGVGSMQAAITSMLDDTTVVISADNMSFSNISFAAGLAAVATGLDIGVVSGLSFDSCVFQASGGAADTLNYVDVVDIETAASDISFANCKFFGRDAANEQFIVGVAIDGFYVDNCDFLQVVAMTSVTPLLDFTGAVTNMEIKNSNFFNNKDAGLHITSDQSDNSGVISYCMFGGADAADSNTGGVDMTGAHAFECFFTGDVAGWAIKGGAGVVYDNA